MNGVAFLICMVINSVAVTMIDFNNDRSFLSIMVIELKGLHETCFRMLLAILFGAFEIGHYLVINLERV